jgi:hypothetical protein
MTDSPWARLLVKSRAVSKQIIIRVGRLEGIDLSGPTPVSLLRPADLDEGLLSLYLPHSRFY